MASSRQFSVRDDWGSEQHAGVSATATDYAPQDYAPAVSRKRRRETAAERQRQALDRTIESEIIPRLMLTHRFEARATGDSKSLAPELEGDEVAHFADVALHQPVEVGTAYLESLVLRGIPPDRLLLDVIGPAARLLGEMWTADRCNFADVTIGLTRLHQMVCELSPLFQSEIEPRQSTRRALLIPCPGEQHTLGLLMVQEYFRRAGWQVHSESPQTPAELLDIVKTELFDVVGFSASCDIHVQALSAAIRSVKTNSRNRAVGIMVGGRLFNEKPEMVARVGADVAAEDARDAVMRLPALLGLARSRC